MSRLCNLLFFGSAKNAVCKTCSIEKWSSNKLETYLNAISFPKVTKEKSKTLDG